MQLYFKFELIFLKCLNHLFLFQGGRDLHWLHEKASRCKTGEDVQCTGSWRVPWLLVQAYVVFRM
jgi:hypothetical protein